VVQLLVEQTIGREGALPLLQVALRQIWDALLQDPAETLRALRGVGGALAKTANRIFDDLNPDKQRIARRAFLAMVNLGEGAADTRRRAALAEIVAANEQVEDVERVLQRFSRWEVRRYRGIWRDHGRCVEHGPHVAHETQHQLF
jgi:Holliday junction resolvasome RuvABC DNA-binding subunit